ncbi:Predicted membrane protein, contains two CBS domains [Ceraceosorus bombacis]|uniref:Predicted membrane protein, contains two CBS domains n=1 Tax=Ceraceosorus bombacis TaxID=401625 RepID=A0A0P1BIC2_9BASI|nr:Predicted membrane protein, contains two CBS domains [Ceraceosorus bombacis]
MTSIEDVFMLPLDARLDYPTLEEVVRSGHSRIPIYIEVDVQLGKSNTGTETPSRRGLLSAFSRKTSSAGTLQHANLTTPSPDGQTTSAFASAGSGSPSGPTDVVKRKKIIGMLLVKQLILLDPEDATPVQDLVINALPEVPFDEPLLTMLNAFQEGRSHMAIVSSRPRRAFAEAARLQHDQDDADKLETGVKSEKSDPEEKPGVDAAKLQSEESNEIHSEYGMPIGIITLEDLLEELLQEEIFDEHDAEGLGLHRISPPPSPTNAAKALVATAGDPQAAAKAEDRSAIPARKTRSTFKRRSQSRP